MKSFGFRFGADVMEAVASWTKNLCLKISSEDIGVDDIASPESGEEISKYLLTWNVLDVGTGNGLLLQELAKQGYQLVLSSS